MTAILTGFLLKLWPYLAAGAAALFGLLKYRQSIIKGERAKQDKARLESIQAKKEKDDEIDALAPADLDARFKRWLQDDSR